MWRWACQRVQNCRSYMISSRLVSICSTSNQLIELSIFCSSIDWCLVEMPNSETLHMVWWLIVYCQASFNVFEPGRRLIKKELVEKQNRKDTSTRILILVPLSIFNFFIKSFFWNVLEFLDALETLSDYEQTFSIERACERI